jgi:hypothetical protein
MMLMNDTLVAKANSSVIILVLLPPDAAHRIQRLDISVFNAFLYMLENQCTNFQNNKVVAITPMAWKKFILGTIRNIFSGFQAANCGCHLLCR